jgi:polyhydroxybutyrate depolymerase
VFCTVEEGRYQIELPKTGVAQGVYLFFHGYKSSAASQMASRSLVEAAHSRGLAFAAVDGVNGTWSHPNAVAADRDEKVFVGHVLDDLEHRFGFGADRVIIGGFSQGASMAWYSVCDIGDRVAAAITFAGVFWNPLPRPENCKAVPPPMVHFHGTADRTFPLEGRAIGGHWHQGDTRKSIAVVEERAQCQAEPVLHQSIGTADCGVAVGCRRGPLALCLHGEGHEARAEWLAAALEYLGQGSLKDHVIMPSR